jgi:transcriptional regulator with XRE-family HTH domain
MTTKTKNVTADDLFKGHPPLTFGAVLRSWRIGEEMSQTELAALLKISRANVCDMEKGRKIPSASRAIKIARKLGMVEARAVELVLRDMLRKERIHMTISVAA